MPPPPEAKLHESGILMPEYGATLENILKKTHLTAEEWKQFATDLLTGINTMHTQEYYHGDCKPRNIAKSKSGKEVFLFDFGNSNKLDYTGDYTDTPHFNLATDIILRKKFIKEDPSKLSELHQKMDVFQMGATLYGLLKDPAGNGENDFPYELDKMNRPKPIDDVHKNKIYQKFTSKFGNENGGKLATLILSMISDNPSKRLTAEKVLKDLNAAFVSKQSQDPSVLPSISTN